MGRESRVTKPRPQGNPAPTELKGRQYDKDKVRGHYVRMSGAVYYVNEDGSYRHARIDELIELERVANEAEKIKAIAQSELDRINNVNKV